MNNSTSYWLKKGIHNGMPIALGYLAVSFTLGIAAKNAGLTALQAALASITCHASAGEFAGFTLIAALAAYTEIAVMELIINARYFLMSCALSQKLDNKMPFFHRLIMGLFVTDEIFGLTVSVPEKLNPAYMYGMVLVASPAWVLGTYFGVLFGNILPANIVSALSVGLYGMFIAIIIPPARKNHRRCSNINDYKLYIQLCPCYKQNFLWNSNYYINSYHLTCGSNSFSCEGRECQKC